MQKVLILLLLTVSLPLLGCSILLNHLCGAINAVLGAIVRALQHLLKASR